MSETPKDVEKTSTNSRRYHDTIADLKKHRETEKLKDELAKKHEESNGRS